MVVLGSRKPLKTVARVAKNPAIEIVYFNLHLKMNANMISLTTGVGVQDGKGHAESENNDFDGHAQLTVNMMHNVSSTIKFFPGHFYGIHSPFDYLHHYSS